MALLHLLALGLAVRFGKQSLWATAPIASVKVTVQGPVCEAAVALHVLEAKQSVLEMLKKRENVELEDIEVEVKRRDVEDEKNACISTSIMLSMTAGATTTMY